MFIGIMQVKRAQDLVAQESTMGVATPSTAASCPRPPKKVLGSGSVDNVQHHLPPPVQPLSARGKIQTQLNQFEVFKPSREDTKRFIPRNVPKVQLPACCGILGPLFHGVVATINPFIPESDQCQISPPAPPEILHHTVRRTWLFIACSDER